MKKILSENFTSMASGLLGVIVGGLITNYHAQKVWDDEKEISIRHKKIELIEKTVKVISSTDEINMLILDNDRLLLILEATKKELDEGTKETNRQHYNRYFENQRDIYKMSGEYAGLIQQNIIFFGKETNAIIEEIDHKFWWKANPAKFQNLIDAMGREILQTKK